MWPGASSHSSYSATRSQPVAQRPLLQPGDRVLRDRFVVTPTTTQLLIARDTETHDFVELRIFPLRDPIPEAKLNRMRQDIRRVALSPHPHIVRIYDAGVVNDALVVATEPRGASLRQILAERRLRPHEALTFARQIAAALIFTHTHGVAHGMLLPGAIEIVGGKTARLAHTGLRHVANAFMQPCPPDLYARPGYQAIEEQQNQPVARPTDMYHFGALLWELMVGGPPPSDHQLDALAAEHDMDRDVQAIIAHCMQPQLQDRPETLNMILPVLRVVQRELAGGVMTRDTGHLPAPMPAPTMLLDDTAMRPSVQRLDAVDIAPSFAASHPRPASAPVTQAHPVAHYDESDVAPTSRLLPAFRKGATAQRSASRPIDPLPWLAEDEAEDIFAAPKSRLESTQEFLVTALKTSEQYTQQIVHRFRNLDRKRQLILSGTLAAGLVLLIVITHSGALFNKTLAANVQEVTLKDATTTLTARSAPYHVSQTLLIGPGKKLAIKPGVTLTFAPNAGIIVQGGVLDAEGTSAAPVLFTSQNDPTLNSATANTDVWQGVQLTTAQDGTMGSAILDNVTIRYAGTPTTAALICKSGALTFTNSLQSDSVGVGLAANKDCAGEVSHTTFQHNGGDAADITSTDLQFHDNVVVGSAVSLP